MQGERRAQMLLGVGIASKRQVALSDHRFEHRMNVRLRCKLNVGAPSGRIEDIRYRDIPAACGRADGAEERPQEAVDPLGPHLRGARTVGLVGRGDDARR